MGPALQPVPADWGLWPRGLWGRLAISLVAALGPLLALLFAVMSAEADRMVANAEWEASEVARLGAEHQEAMLQAATSLLRVLSRVALVQNAEPQCGDVLAGVVASMPQMAAITVA